MEGKMTNQADLTDRINEQLAKAAKANKVSNEDLRNTLLLLSLSNESSVDQAVTFIKLWGREGTTKPERGSAKTTKRQRPLW